MNITNQTKQHIIMVRTLLFSLGLILSCNVFAKGGPKATQSALEAAVTDLQSQIDDILISPTYEIGDEVGGGIVFYVNEIARYVLVAARYDQSMDITWYHNASYIFTGATGDGLGAGKMNTAIIVSTQTNDDQMGNFAAKVAADYSVQEDGVTACTGLASDTCYGDWYVPSKFELNLLYEEKDAVGLFAVANYWSSSENNRFSAWFQYFGNGDQGPNLKENTFRVRAVRAFNY